MTWFGRVDRKRSRGKEGSRERRRERKTLGVAWDPGLPSWARFVSRPDQGVGMHTPRLWRFFGVAELGNSEEISNWKFEI